MKLEKFTNNNINYYFVSYQRQGNDKNGNPIFIINVFDENLNNINYSIDRRSDKYGNIKLTSYSIKEDIKHMLNSIK